MTAPAPVMFDTDGLNIYFVLAIHLHSSKYYALKSKYLKFINCILKQKFYFKKNKHLQGSSALTSDSYKFFLPLIFTSN